MPACAIQNCPRPSRSRGWCVPHYTRWWKHGDPLGGQVPGDEKLRWLLANYQADPDGPCVVWPYPLDMNGYGQAIFVDGRYRRPHSYATELRDGPAPQGMEAVHGSCHNPACILHVRWGTHAENMADMIRDRTTRRYR